jgi:hypothetical protein
MSPEEMSHSSTHLDIAPIPLIQFEVGTGEVGGGKLCMKKTLGFKSGENQVQVTEHGRENMDSDEEINGSSMRVY